MPALAGGLLLALLASANPGCERYPAPAIQKPRATAAATATATTTADDAPAQKQVSLARLPTELIAAFQDRQRCNLLQGCDPETILVGLGPSAVDAACAFYDGTREESDRYYRSRVLAALGRMGGPGAVQCLMRAFSEGPWLDQAMAAFALGALRAADAQEVLQASLDDPGKVPNLAVRAGILYALTKLGAEPALDELWRALDPGGASISQWVYLRFVVNAAARLGARAQAGSIALLVAHPDYYLKRASLRALAQLGDPSVARAVAAALDTDYPGIQREATRTLRSLILVGSPEQPKTVEQWRAWRDERWAPRTLAPAVPKAPGGPSSAPSKPGKPEPAQGSKAEGPSK